MAEEHTTGGPGPKLEPDQIRCDLLYYLGLVVRNMSGAKAELLALIGGVQGGSEVIIAKARRPEPWLVAFRGPARPRKPGAMAGEIWIAAEFDTLPDDMAEAFGMKEPLPKPD